MLRPAGRAFITAAITAPNADHIYLYEDVAAVEAQLVEAGFEADVVDKVVSLVDRAEWKRRQFAPGPKISALAFGRDRRLPITSRWREHATPPAPLPQQDG
jgi:hypothetical protein